MNAQNVQKVSVMDSYRVVTRLMTHTIATHLSFQFRRKNGCVLISAQTDVHLPILNACTDKCVCKCLCIDMDRDANHFHSKSVRCAVKMSEIATE